MLGSLLLVFRETLEAVLIITIVLAATRGIAGRHRWIAFGILAGVAGAGVVALSAEAIMGALAGLGQDLFNVGLLLAAAILLAWHAVWMARHASHLKTQFRAMGAAVIEGQRPMYLLALVVGIAILREGSEIVLFMFGLAAGGSENTALLAGGVLGLVLGILLGAVIYFSLLAVPLRHLFRVTGFVIVLMAAGLAAHAVQYLMQANILAPQQALWDTSFLIPQNSAAGQALSVLVGYMAQPTPNQLITYAATCAVIFLALWYVNRDAPAGRPAGG